MDLISRKDAKAQKLPHYFTGKPCKRGHVAERLTSSKSCIVCCRVESMTPERIARKRERSREENMTSEQIARKRERNSEKNMTPEQIARRRERGRVENMTPEQVARNRERNSEKNMTPEQIARRRERRRMWGKVNPGKRNFYTRKRQADQLERVPDWLTWDERMVIQALYVKAAHITKETGIPHHVDHIYPLLGDDVSGLHVLSNLQIITANENLRKGKRHPLAFLTGGPSYASLSV